MSSENLKLVQQTKPTQLEAEMRRIQNSSNSMEIVSDSENKDTSYFKTKLSRELLLCICAFYFGLYSPKIFRSIFGMNIRPIPYQVLTSGDVVLDLGLNHPLIDDVTVPSKLLLQMSITFPLLFLILVTQISPRCAKKYFDTHSSVCVLLLSIGMSEFTTQMAKMYVGRLRPNFYALCEFDIQKLECTASEEHIMESRSSFPSGHSSLSFTGMGVLVWFLLGRSSTGFGPFGERKRRLRKFGNPKVSAVLALLPLCWATFVACSRLVDNWHHPSDIVAGTCIGVFFPSLVYHLYYPSFISNEAGLPLSYLNSACASESSSNFEHFAWQLQRPYFDLNKCTVDILTFSLSYIHVVIGDKIKNS